MTRAYVPLLLTLAAVWGASYLFIKVAVDEIAPVAMVEGRLLLAALALSVYLISQLGLGPAVQAMRAAGWQAVLLGVVNGAIPFTLIAWGEQHVDSGVAAIANATVPLFLLLLAIRFRPSERASGLRLAGLGLGLAGVVVLSGMQSESGWWAIAGTLAVVVASIAYASGALYAQSRLADTTGHALAAASMLGAAVVLLPLALLELPQHVPSGKALGSLAALSLAGTAFAQLVLFRIIRLHGPARTSLVTYLLPPTALLYGALFLDEPLTVAELAGLGLIFLGVAVGSGVLRLPSRATVRTAP